jgi:hypothetical protein
MRGSKFDVADDEKLFADLFDLTLQKQSTIFPGVRLTESIASRQEELPLSAHGYISNLQVRHLSLFYNFY